MDATVVDLFWLLTACLSDSIAADFGVNISRQRVFFSGRRCQYLLDDFNENRTCWELKEETLDRALWRTRFGRRPGPDRLLHEWIAVRNSRKFNVEALHARHQYVTNAENLHAFHVGFQHCVMYGLHYYCIHSSATVPRPKHELSCTLCNLHARSYNHW